MEPVVAFLKSHIYLEVALAVLAVVYVYFRIKRREIIKYGNEIPGDDPLPLFGNALQFRSIKTLTDALTIMESILSKYTEFGLIRFWFGPFLGVGIWDPAYLEVIANSPHAANKPASYNIIFGELSNGVFSMEGGPTWKELRKPLTKSFTKKYLDKEYFDVFIKRSKHFRDYIIRNRLGRYYNTKEDFAPLTADIFLETHLGLITCDLEDRRWNYAQIIDDFFDVSITGFLKFSCFIMKDMVRYTHLRARILDLKKRTDIIMDWIFEVREKKQREDNFEYYSDFLLRRSQETNTSKDEMYKQLVDVLTAGLDTSAIVLCSAALFMAMYPEVQEEVYTELATIFGDSGRDPTLEDMQAMGCLERVVKETIRMVAPPGIVKQVDGNIRLGKYTIPAGTQVYLFTYKTHRDPRYWEKPNSFYPDHFLPDMEKTRPRFAYMPFGCGPRICPGYQYGINSELIILSTLLRTFKFTTKMKFEEIRFDYRLMLTIQPGYYLQFEKRQK